MNGEGTASLEKAMDILEAVGASPQGLSQTELSARLAVPRTTLYRLLATLVARGMIRRDPLRRVYCLGFRCFELARSAYAMPDLAAAASVELRALRDLTGETSYLATLDGLEVLSLERYDGAHSQRSQAALGQRKPLHCTSQGKAILSALDEATRDALVQGITLKALTPRSITDRRRLQAELRITAARGWSVDDEEIALGVRCVGAPVVDAAGKVRGAISVAGPAYRMTMERVQGLGPEVAEAARRVGAQLSAREPAPAAAVARVVPGPWAFRGEFARWSAQYGGLFWADSLAPSVRLFDGQQDREIAVFDAPLTALVPTDSALLVGSQGGYWRIEQPHGRSPQVGALQPWAAGTPSALCAGPADSVWACEAVAGSRWRVGLWTAAGASAVDGGWLLGEPLDALAWDGAGQCLYGLARDSGVILVMQRGQAAVRRLATVPKGSGRLSGLAVDRSGGIWTALQDGWSVVRFSPDGNQDRVIGLPVPCPSGLALGGEQLDTLYVTSARQPVSLETLGNAPLSGRLFCLDISG
ncbi:IclR family transcriptional regulator C-terminal domain-containing protein [Polaromonas sp.]|uniref:IclR family transcriptional regulator domain-containing protein n=1 Tax=Polaromonas sp. TaxID=1869339 RepID=UPI00286CB4FF|nr:IclR family transcriptional regulator C-terminal domain-containing protein [Polaromonas sp.]